MVMIKTFAGILLTFWLLLLTGCGGGNGGGGGEGGASTGSVKQNVSGTITPPAGVAAESLLVTSLGTTSTATSQGSYSTKVYQDGVAAIMAIPQGKSFGLMNIVASSSSATSKGSPAKIAAAGTISANNSIALNTKTTAVSMVFITPFFLTNNAAKATSIISIIESDPKVDTLATVIDTVFTSADPMNDTRLQQALSDAIQSVWHTIKTTAKPTAEPVTSPSVKTLALPKKSFLTAKLMALLTSAPYSSDQDYVNINAVQNGSAYDISIESKNFGSVDWFSEVMKLDAPQFSSFSDFQGKQLNNRTIYQGEGQQIAGRLSAPAKSIFRYADLLTLSTDYISKTLFGNENPAKVSISSTEDGIYLVRSFSGSFGMLVDPSEKNFVRNSVPTGTLMDNSSLVLNTVTLSLDMASIFVDVESMGKDVVKVAISAAIDLSKDEASSILSDPSPSFNSLISMFQKVVMAIFKSLVKNDGILHLVGNIMETGVKSIVDVTGKISSAGQAVDRFSQMLTSATPMETTFIVVGSPLTASPPPTATTHSISGRITSNDVGLTGVTVSLSGTASISTVTDANGEYVFANAVNGTYTITAVKAGNNFTPSSINNVVVNGANITDNNFTATPIATNIYSISGTITTGGVALAGVMVSTAGGTASTSSNGNYTISNLANGNYTLTPSKSGYSFSPASQSVTVNGANITGKNFTVASAPRFIDKGNGTIYDTVSNLTWLKNANCFGYQTKDNANAKSYSLASGQCGLSDGSTAGDWHLPSIDELRIFVDAGYYSVTLNAAGFSNVQASEYWSSSIDYTHSSFWPLAWYVDMSYYGYYGIHVGYEYTGTDYYVWPVRWGQ